ncbi:MAG: nucleotidyl transferase AbiEii/AbiGii toxin family protein [Deltaproteobacteria bacterium]|jgi:hypothetical protein|nr:nucleotidyl transferase AbiEii/AbiGii toxin family protein [Deltaproteobacteria bacterium]
MKLKPKLDILPEGQRLLWPYLRDMPKAFVLYGGTAVALRYGHRQSVDFDFFTSKQGIDLQKTGEALPFIGKFLREIRKSSENHVDFYLDVNGNIVKLTLLNNQDIVAGSVNPPDICEDNTIKMATPVDLMACKVLALHNRSEARDYVDVAEMIKQGIPLQKGFEAAQAISRLSRRGTSQLMLDSLQGDFCSKAVAQIVSSVPDTAIAAKAEESAAILRQAAQSLDIRKAYATSMKAQACIERSAMQERDR